MVIKRCETGRMGNFMNELKWQEEGGILRSGDYCIFQLCNKPGVWVARFDDKTLSDGYSLQIGLAECQKHADVLRSEENKRLASEKAIECVRAFNDWHPHRPISHASQLASAFALADEVLHLLGEKS